MMDGFIVPAKITPDDVGQVWAKATDEKMQRLFDNNQGEFLTTTCKSKHGRDPILHAQFFAILRGAVHSLRLPGGDSMYQITSKLEEDAAVDHLRVTMAYAVGFTKTDTYYELNTRGELEKVERTNPRSIAFDDCDEEAAEGFRRLAYQQIALWLGVPVGRLISGAL